ncbi:MAG: ABC transporter ATP-binding protein [Bacteroidetes bacterium]|nr:ABC transporter ATP-binding protein [Bacteroidota bacterium]
MSLIELENITKVYHAGEISVNALKGISLKIEKKSFVSFIGPSGSGKSTLLNLIGILDKPTNGKMIVNGTDVRTLDRTAAARFRGKTIGFVFQNFNLIPVLTVYENIEYPLLMLEHLHSNERRKRVLRLLEKVGMTDQRDKYPNQISGGQKQRVAVARALVTNPQIVLADEPTANLDHATAFKIITIMHEMTSDIGTTFIFSTHDSKIVGEAEVIHTLEDGAIVKTDTRKVHDR